MSPTTIGGVMEIIPSKPMTGTSSTVHDLLAEAAIFAVLEGWSDVEFQTEANTAFESVDVRGNDAD
jgi:hypothetical protein